MLLIFPSSACMSAAFAEKRTQLLSCIGSHVTLSSVAQVQTLCDCHPPSVSHMLVLTFVFMTLQTVANRKTAFSSKRVQCIEK